MMKGHHCKFTAGDTDGAREEVNEAGGAEMVINIAVALLEVQVLLPRLFPDCVIGQIIDSDFGI